MRSLGLIGAPESGRDLIAALLSMIGYTRYSFEDLVREEITSVRKSKPKWPERCPLSRFTYLDSSGAWAAWHTQDLWAFPISDPIQTLLHWWDRARNKKDPSHWTALMDKKIRSREESKRTLRVWPDVRRESEAQWVRQQGGRIWLVVGPKHSTQKPEYLNIVPDSTIISSGGLHEVVERIRGLIK